MVISRQCDHVRNESIPAVEIDVAQSGSAPKRVTNEHDTLCAGFLSELLSGLVDLLGEIIETSRPGEVGGFGIGFWMSSRGQPGPKIVEHEARAERSMDHENGNLRRGHRDERDGHHGNVRRTSHCQSQDDNKTEAFSDK